MKVLLVAATLQEVKPFLDQIGWANSSSSFELGASQFDLLITGVGMVATSFSLGKHLSNHKYDLAINVGLAGTFDKNIKLGEVVEVILDQFSEEGAEDDVAFLNIEKLGLRPSDEFPFEQSKLVGTELKQLNSFKKVEGITVNTVHGREASIAKVVSRLNPQVESMEGASFFYACKMMQTKCIQLRAISNVVEKRNRSNWNIELALDNLATQLQVLLKQF